MESVLRALAIYLVLMLLMRLAGKRSLANISSFDLVLLLVISEATQQALLGDDFSATTAIIVITTLVAVDRLSDYLGFRFPTFSKATESKPMILVQDGEPLKHRLRRVHVNESDILQSARQSQGLERMEQIKYAVLETSGGISIIPRSDK